MKNLNTNKEKVRLMQWSATTHLIFLLKMDDDDDDYYNNNNNNKDKIKNQIFILK